MNSMQVKDKLKNVIRNRNIDFNTALKFYVFDRFIIRLARSKYKDNFIIKGGFLLSIIFGLENRSTMDLDTAVTNAKFTKENVLEMIKTVINIELEDNIKFSLQDVEKIREEDLYGGYRINLLFEFENIKEFLKIDVATGDIITPRTITYRYKTMLEDTTVNILSYNIETIIAEKLETIFNRVETSSRMKDYYDIYLIYQKDWNNINHKVLIKAIKNTFEQRNLNKDLLETFNIIKNSIVLRIRWKSYSNKNKYANNISYEEIMKCLEKIIETINTRIHQT